MTADAYRTTTELAERWRTSTRAVRTAIKQQQLPATFIAGQWLVRQSDVDAYEAARATRIATPKRTRRPQRRAS